MNSFQIKYQITYVKNKTNKIIHNSRHKKGNLLKFKLKKRSNNKSLSKNL